MDDSQFDRLTRLAAQPRSRRGALGVLAGLAGLGLGEASARKRRGKARAHAADTGKTTICHHDQDAGVYVKITVADAAWPAHQKHGDFLHDDCCNDGECSDGDPCTASTCAKGTCRHTPTPGASCDAGTGPASGACDSAGACQPNAAHVCSGKYSPSPCYEGAAATCGGTGKACRCGTDIHGNPNCYENSYLNSQAGSGQCTSNLDCERMLNTTGAACHSDGGCYSGLTFCTTPCPAPSS